MLSQSYWMFWQRFAKQENINESKIMNVRKSKTNYLHKVMEPKLPLTGSEWSSWSRYINRLRRWGDAFQGTCNSPKVSLSLILIPLFLQKPDYSHTSWSLLTTPPKFFTPSSFTAVAPNSLLRFLQQNLFFELIQHSLSVLTS